MNSVERVKAICKERKIPISKIEKDLGFANGYIGQLRKGVFPADRLKNIAEYLDVSTEYLLSGYDNESKINTISVKKPQKWLRLYLRTEIYVCCSMRQKMPHQRI